MDLKQKGYEVADILSKAQPSPKTELKFSNETEFAVAVMLSAQTTDKKVNEITESLFRKYTCWEDYTTVDLSELQADIRGANFHLGKADRIIKAAHYIIQQHGGVLPRTLEELIKIPGIARKSANVILQELWDISEGIVVDTHVSRVSIRLGLTEQADPVRIERDLMAIIPREYWRNFSGTVVLHGRYVCTARKPDCSKCILKEKCTFYLNTIV